MTAATSKPKNSSKLNSKLNPVYIPDNERGFIAGQTGSGKSELSRVLVEDKRRLFVIDPKHQFETRQPYVVVTEIDDIPKVAHAAWNSDEEIKRGTTVGKGIYAVIWRPDQEVLEDMEEQNRVWRWVRATQNCFVLIDELLSSVRNAQAYPLTMKACYLQGRSLDIGILGLSQRPSGIPLFTIESCSRLWEFYLKNPDDQERMAKYMGDVVIEPRNLPKTSPYKNRVSAHVKYGFYYDQQGVEQEPRQYILDIEDEKAEVVDGDIRNTDANKHGIQ